MNLYELNQQLVSKIWIEKAYFTYFLLSKIRPVICYFPGADFLSAAHSGDHDMWIFVKKVDIKFYKNIILSHT